MPLLDIITKGSTDRSVTIRICDSTDGTPETAVEHNTSGIDLWYRREGAAKVSITEAALSALTDAHSDGGIEHIGDGYYRLDLPDAAFDTGANYVDIGGTVTDMIVFGGRIRLVDYSLEDAVRMGLSALPNAAADAAGGLPISDAGGLDLDARLDAAVSSRMATYTQPTGFLTATFPTTVASTTNITAASGVTLTAAYDAAKTAAQAGDQMDLVDAPNATARTAIGTTLEAMMLDEGDATALLTAIAAKVEEFLVNEGDATATIAAIAAAVDAAITSSHGAGSYQTATGFATPTNVTDARDAILTEGGSSWTTATGFSTLDAAGVRTAIGLASADLDTQLGDIPTVSEFNARTLAAADYFDPATDTVAHVTLVDTTTTNTDMRGTDSAYTGTPPAAAAIADAVWDEMTSGHSTAGTTGKALTDAGSAGDPWSTALPGAYTGSQAGKVLADVLDDVTGLDGSAMRGTDSAYTGTPPSAAAISAQVAADLATAHGAGSWQTATGFAVSGDAMTLTAAYDAAKTAAQAGDQMDLVDSPNATAVSAVQNGLSTFDASTDEVNLAADQSGVTVGTVNALAANSITSSVLATDCITSGKIATDAIGASELSAAAINAIQSGLATAANQVTILTNQTTTAEYIDTEVAAVKAVTDKLDDTLEDDLGTYRFTANALEQAPSGGGGGLTQQQVRDAMKLAPTAGDPAAGSVDAHLDDIVEDTGMTLPAAISAIDAGTGSGAHSVTATVNDGTNPVQNARVTYKLNGMTVATGVTDDEGVAPAFSLDSATYTVVITASGYTFTSTTHAVSGDATPTYSMTAIVITAAPSGYTTGWLYSYDEDGDVEEAASYRYRPVTPNAAATGESLSPDWNTVTSDANGKVEFPRMRLGVTYEYQRVGNDRQVGKFKIPTDADSTTPLPQII